MFSFLHTKDNFRRGSPGNSLLLRLSWLSSYPHLSTKFFLLCSVWILPFYLEVEFAYRIIVKFYKPLFPLTKKLRSHLRSNTKHNFSDQLTPKKHLRLAKQSCRSSQHCHLSPDSPVDSAFTPPPAISITLRRLYPHLSKKMVSSRGGWMSFIEAIWVGSKEGSINKVTWYKLYGKNIIFYCHLAPQFSWCLQIRLVWMKGWSSLFLLQQKKQTTVIMEGRK